MLAWKYLLTWFYLVFDKDAETAEKFSRNTWYFLGIIQKTRHIHKLWLFIKPLSFEKFWTPALLYH